MGTIWKFELLPSETDHYEIEMPEGAEILSVHNQNERLCVWAVVEPTAPLTRRRFMVYGTGYTVNKKELCPYFRGTALMADGSLVLHVWSD